MRQPWLVNWLLLTVTLAPPPAQAPTSDATSREAFAHYRAGQEQLSGERWDAAAQEFRAAIALDVRFVDAHYGLGQAYMGATRFPSAVVAFTACLDAARAIHGLRDRDRVAVDRQLDEQIRELKDTVQRMARQPSQAGQPGQAARLKIVQLEQRIGDLERSRSSNSGPFEPPAGVLLALGSAHFRNGHRDEAELRWREATKANPRLGEAWNNLAVVYLQTARKAEARNAVERAERAGFRVHPQLKDDISRMPGR